MRRGELYRVPKPSSRDPDKLRLLDRALLIALQIQTD
jgi:hypothetical protein